LGSLYAGCSITGRVTDRSTTDLLDDWSFREFDSELRRLQEVFIYIYTHTRVSY